MNKSYVHCDFSKWFINYLKNVNELKLFGFFFYLMSIFSIHISEPATYRSKSNSLIGFHVYISTNFEFTGWVSIQILQHDDCKF